MTVLAIVQSWNERDPVRGFTVGWIGQLARETGRVVVIALEKRHEPSDPRITVISLGKEAGAGTGFRLRYLFSWHRAITSAFRLHRPDVIFTHMTPLYSLLAFPYALRYRVPIVTWFLHPRGGIVTRLAHMVSSRAVSASRESYPYPDRKLVPIGHGIDTGFFSPGAGSRDVPPLILSAGRISPIKNCALLIDAAAILRDRGFPAFSVMFAGGPVTGADRAYQACLERHAASAGLADTVRFVSALPADALRDAYRCATLHVNCTESGSGDKVILEAMACGTPSLAVSPVFSDAFGAYRRIAVSAPHAVALAEHIGDILTMPPAAYAAFRATCLEGVRSRYSLPVFFRSLTRVFHEIRPGR